MAAGPSRSIPVLTHTQARELAGKCWRIDGTYYRFKPLDPRQPGQPSWRSGAEGKAFPLLDPQGRIAAYLKFFSIPSQKRLLRTQWLIAQQMDCWLASLAAAPRRWADTQELGRPPDTPFDFAGCLAQAVPGFTWLELKYRIAQETTPMLDSLRWRCACDLIRATALLESAGIVHGDLSPNNIIVDPGAPPDQPALYLIDFDAFVAQACRGADAVSAEEGGTYGTEGYCPPDLVKKAGAGVNSVAPYSDRFARDMLLLELLLMGPGCPADEPPAKWNQSKLRRQIQACMNRSTLSSQVLAYLQEIPGVFSWPEHARAKSCQIAGQLGLSLPPAPTLRQAPRLAQVRPARPAPPPQAAPAPPRPRRASRPVRVAYAVLGFIVIALSALM